MDFFKKNTWMLVLLFAFLSRIFLFNPQKIVMWDAAVYLMNAKWFIGQQIYFEILRPPAFPLILGFFYKIGFNEALIQLVPIILSVLSIFVVYLLAKEVFGKPAGLISALLLMLNPLHLYWSPQQYTEITAMLFMMLSMLFLYKGLKEGKYIYLSVFFGTVAFLTRYPCGMILPIIFAVLIINKKITLKNVLISALIVTALVLPWLAYNQIYYNDWFRSLNESQYWVSLAPSEPIYYYIMHLPETFSLTLIFLVPGIIFALRMFKEKSYLPLFIFIIVFLAYFTYFAHKEIRYLLPVLPFIIILASKWLADSTGKLISKYRSKAIVIILAGAVALYVSQFLYVGFWGVNCTGINESAQGLDGIVASVYWPQTAYYGSVQVRAMPGEKDDMYAWITDYNITYFVVSEYASWPPYGNDFAFWDSLTYLELYKKVNDNCLEYRVYQVKKNI